MLSPCSVRCTFVASSDHFSLATTFWWSLNWSLKRSLIVFGLPYEFSILPNVQNAKRVPFPYSLPIREIDFNLTLHTFLNLKVTHLLIG